MALQCTMALNFDFYVTSVAVVLRQLRNCHMVFDSLHNDLGVLDSCVSLSSCVERPGGKLVAIFLIISVHIGFGVCLQLGLFPWVPPIGSLISLYQLGYGEKMSWYLRCRHSGRTWTIFYDPSSASGTLLVAFFRTFLCLVNVSSYQSILQKTTTGCHLPAEGRLCPHLQWYIFWTTVGKFGTATGTYSYSSNSFFPIDKGGFGYNSVDGPKERYNGNNYYFTVELQKKFFYRGGEVFSFTSANDMWVFINGKGLFILREKKK